jgi:hypothetical protein
MKGLGFVVKEDLIKWLEELPISHLKNRKIDLEIAVKEAN